MILYNIVNLELSKIYLYMRKCVGAVVKSLIFLHKTSF